MAPFHTVALKHVTLSDSEGSLPTKFETLPGTDPPGQVLVAANAPSHRPEGGTCTVRDLLSKSYGVSFRESDMEHEHAKDKSE